MNEVVPVGVEAISTPSVSVVIATYNRPHGLVALLDDLDRQTGLGDDGFEVVIIDDGSAPPARSVVELRTSVPSGQDYPLVFLEQANAGQGAARDRGIGLARGEIIVILDDDMRVSADFVAAHLRAHRAGAEVVQGAIVPPPHDVPLFERWHMAQLEVFAREIRDGRTSFRGAHLSTGNVSFRKARYVEVGGFDPTLKRSEDRDLGIRFELAGATLAFSHEATSVHHSDHTSIDVWMGRAYRYGTDDSFIARKHPNFAYVDPWRFLGEVNPVSRLFLLLATFFPRVAKPVSRLAMTVATRLDRMGRLKVALAGTTLVYGMEYFRGMRRAAGSSRASLRDLRRYRQKLASDAHREPGTGVVRAA